MTTTRATLTDRYVWTVTRHLSDDTGPDVATELRGSIADMVAARVETGQDPVEAEDAALTELGDPEVLARDYGGRPGHLIGPGVYPDYVRLLKLLLAVSLPLAAVGSFLSQVAAAEQSWGQALLDTFLLLMSVAVHVVFWTTVVFAIVERSRPEAERDRPLSRWDTDRLPTEGPWRQVRLGDFGLAASLLVAIIALAVWQFTGAAVEGAGVQVLDPDLAPGWKAMLIGLLLVDLAVEFMVWRVGRWTTSLAVVSVLANVAAAAVLLWLVRTEQLLVADLPQRLSDEFGWSADWSVPVALLAALVVVIPLWDSVETIRQARRARTRPEAHD